MTIKAQKLARELIALSERYSDQDFELAEDLLRSGKLFEPAVHAAKTTRNVVNSIKHNLTIGRHLPRYSGTKKTSKVVSGSVIKHDLDDLFSNLNEIAREDLYKFSKRFNERDILQNGPSIRIFADQLGIQLPKKLPSRHIVLRTMLKKLLDFPPDKQSNLLIEADRIGSGDSSLQRWSDVIVKSNSS